MAVRTRAAPTCWSVLDSLVGSLSGIPTAVGFLNVNPDRQHTKKMVSVRARRSLGKRYSDDTMPVLLKAGGSGETGEQHVEVVYGSLKPVRWCTHGTSFSERLLSASVQLAEATRG